MSHLAISIMLPDSRVAIAKALEESGYEKNGDREVTYVFETALVRYAAAPGASAP